MAHPSMQITKPSGKLLLVLIQSFWMSSEKEQQHQKNFIAMATMRAKLAFCRPRFYRNSHFPSKAQRNQLLPLSSFHRDNLLGPPWRPMPGVSLPPDHPVFPTAPHHNWRIPGDFIQLLPSSKHFQMPRQQSTDFKKNTQDPLCIPVPARKLK